MRRRIGFMLLVAGFSGCAAVGGGVQDEASITAHLKQHKIDSHTLMILDQAVAKKFRSLPFVVVADAGHRFVWKHEGYTSEIGREMEQGVWVYRPARASNLPLWPLKTPAGKRAGWGDFPKAKFIVFVFWNLRCSLCPGLIDDLQTYIRARKPGEYALVLIDCDPYSFGKREKATGS